MANRSIEVILKILSRNSELLQAISDGKSIKYAGGSIEDYPNSDIELLNNIGVLKKIGDNNNGYLDFSPEARTFFNKLEGTDSLVTDKKVEAFVTSLSNFIKDYKSNSDPYDRIRYIKSIKGLLSDVTNSSVDTVVGMAYQVEDVYSHISDLKRKREKLEDFLKTDKSLMELTSSVIQVITTEMREVRIQENDVFLDAQISFCKKELHKVSMELQRILRTLQKYIVNIKEKIKKVSRLHKLKALKDEGLLERPDVSNYMEIIKEDNALYNRGAYRRRFAFSLEDINEETPIGKAISRLKVKTIEKKKAEKEIFHPLPEIQLKTEALPENEDYENMYERFVSQDRKDLFSFILEETRGNIERSIDLCISIYGTYPDKLTLTEEYNKVNDGDFVIIKKK